MYTISLSLVSSSSLSWSLVEPSSPPLDNCVQHLRKMQFFGTTYFRNPYANAYLILFCCENSELNQVIVWSFASCNFSKVILIWKVWEVLKFWESGRFWSYGKSERSRRSWRSGRSGRSGRSRRSRKSRRSRIYQNILEVLGSGGPGGPGGPGCQWRPQSLHMVYKVHEVVLWQ